MLTAGELADWIGAGIEASVGSVEARAFSVRTVAALTDAGEGDASVFIAASYRPEFEASKARVFLISTALYQQLVQEKHARLASDIFIVSQTAYSSFAEWTRRLSPLLSSVDHQENSGLLQGGVHTSALVAADAVVHPSAVVGPNVTIASGAKVEANVVLYAGVYIGPKCTVGEGSVLFPNVTLLESVTLGRRCRLHAGAVLGADGFGYAPEFSGRVPVNHRKIYHLGSVICGDDVEIGANSTIDRGTLGATTIGSKVKIDNQVQVGHNCSIGEGAILCGAVGVAGTSRIGRFVMIGAGSGISNNVKVGDYARIGALSGVARDVPEGAEYWGVPARPMKETMRILATQARMAKRKGDRK
jgi:UDP-3-O-[3-hydroxymyristoyl] glucosamine N-acyltransferase